MNNKYINDKHVSETDAESGVVGLQALLMKDNNKNPILYKAQPFLQGSQERNWEHTRDVWSRCHQHGRPAGSLAGQTQRWAVFKVR